jgi:hypothetical protein
MKGFFAALLIIFGVSICNPGASAQSPMSPPPYGDYTVPKGANISDIGSPRLYDPDRLRENRVVKKGPLAPSVSDRQALASFLRTKNTGLIRLLSREAQAELRSGTKKQHSIPGGGVFYSFTELSHAYPYVSDISLARGDLSVGSSGMLTRLGDVPLEEITVGDPRLLFISTYAPSRDPFVAQAERSRFRQGVTVEGALYSKGLPADEKVTYLLRSIVYRKADILVAFRVVKKESNGSVTLAWKLLKKYPVPKLSRS